MGRILVTTYGCSTYLKEAGTAVTGKDPVVLSRRMVLTDLAGDVVQNPT
jgi:hypothetical protein